MLLKILIHIKRFFLMFNRTNIYIHKENETWNIFWHFSEMKIYLEKKLYCTLNAKTLLCIIKENIFQKCMSECNFREEIAQLIWLALICLSLTLSTENFALNVLLSFKNLHYYKEKQRIEFFPWVQFFHSLLERDNFIIRLLFIYVLSYIRL